MLHYREAHIELLCFKKPVAVTWLSWGFISLGYTIKNEQVNEVIQILKVLFAVLIAINLKAQ